MRVLKRKSSAIAGGAAHTTKVVWIVLSHFEGREAVMGTQMFGAKATPGLRRKFGWRAMTAITVLVIAGVALWSWFKPSPAPAVNKASGVVASAPAPSPALQLASAVVVQPVATVASAPVKEKLKVAKVMTAPTSAKQATVPILASTPKAPVVETPKVAEMPLVVGQASPKQPASSKLFRWTKVGGDPCNPKAGCTLEWALEKTGWPQKVQVALMAAVKGSSPETITITSGLNGSKGPTWSGWMTWGKYQPKFEMHTIAAWPDGQHEPASMWSYEDDEDMMGYTLIKVKKCGNWGGSTRVIHKKPPPVHVATAPTPQPQQPAMMPFGNNPGLGAVACIDE